MRTNRLNSEEKKQTKIGAAELKKVYNKNLLIGLFTAVLVNLIIMMFFTNVRKGDADSPKNHLPNKTIEWELKDLTKLENIPNKISKQSNTTKFSQTKNGGNGKSAMPKVAMQNVAMQNVAKVATPANSLNKPIISNSVASDVIKNSNIDINDSLKSNLSNTNSNTNLNASGANNDNNNGGNNGGGKDKNNGNLNNNSNKNNADENSDDGDFVSVEKEVQFSYQELMQNVEYPALARNNGVTGKVTIQIFVNENGVVAKTRVVQSDSKLLEQAAIDATKKVKYVPAEQNGNKVGTWVSIPVVFELKD